MAELVYCSFASGSGIHAQHLLERQRDVLQRGLVREEVEGLEDRVIDLLSVLRGTFEELGSVSLKSRYRRSCTPSVMCGGSAAAVRRSPRAFATRLDSGTRLRQPL
jgi:hypothetical protein